MSNPPVIFPVEVMPTDARHARLVGLYPQRQDRLWMQRVRVHGGRLTGRQWSALAEIAGQLTRGDPLHLTTRQGVEIHGLSERNVPQAQQAMAVVDLTGLGSCGDTIRSVTVCPCSGAAANAPELLPLATRITELLQSEPQAFDLPRKFKVSLSACRQACGLPWMQDVGLVADVDGTGWSFRATVAGSLGRTPGLGVAWPGMLPPEQAPAFVLAAMRLLAEHGDRKHRARARLRHVRERLGDAAFLTLLGEQFGRARDTSEPVPVSLKTRTPALRHRRRLAVPEGNISPETAATLGDLVGDDLEVRLGLHHEFWLYAAERNVVEEAVARLPAEWRHAPTIVACPGIRWCARGLVDSQTMGRRLRETLTGTPAVAWIGISGCPNGCAHSAVADIGLIGRINRSAGQRVEVYRVLTGGSARLAPRVAEPLHDDVPSDRIPAIIRAQWAQSQESSDDCQDRDG